MGINCVCVHFLGELFCFFPSRMYISVEWCAYKVRLVFFLPKIIYGS